MSQPQNTGEFDAVLGGTKRAPEGAAVLGGIQGLLIHYQEDTNPNNRIVIIQKALNYGKKGTDFLLEVMKNDDSWEVKDVAYELLLSKDSELDPPNRIEIIQQALNHGKKGTDFLLEVMKNDDSWKVKDLAYELLLSKDRELAKSSGYIDTTNMPQVFLKLNSLLQAQNFKEADKETRKIILAVAKREKEGWLRIEDAEKFPCKELRTIDQLWLKYSRGKFGISVQQQIYQSLGGTKEYNQDVWKSMADRVGWRQGSEWLAYSNLNFTQTATSGHLPFPNKLYCGWGVASLLSRHAQHNT